MAGVRVGSETIWERDADCNEVGTEASCDGAWRRSGYVASGRLVILDGLALDGEIGWSNDQIRQAGYSGSGLLYAAGLRGAIPMGQYGWWLAAVGRYERGLNKNESSNSYAQSAYQLGTATGLLAWRDENISLWFGGQGAWLWTHDVEQRTSADAQSSTYDVSLQTGYPVSGVIGTELISSPLGPGWTTPWRLAIGFEVSMGQSKGAFGSATVRY